MQYIVLHAVHCVEWMECGCSSCLAEESRGTRHVLPSTLHRLSGYLRLHRYIDQPIISAPYACYHALVLANSTAFACLRIAFREATLQSLGCAAGVANVGSKGGAPDAHAAELCLLAILQKVADAPHQMDSCNSVLLFGLGGPCSGCRVCAS